MSTVAHYRRRGAKWQAIVTLPSGRQVTRTDSLKKVVQGWAGEVEADIRRGRWHDPRPARALTVEAWRAEWMAGRVVETVTRRKDDAHWRTRIKDRWAQVPLTEVRRGDTQAWVASLVADGVGAHTIAGSVNHLGALLQAAVEADPPLLATNPARGLHLPRTDAGRLRYFTHDEAASAITALDGQYATLVDLGCHVGLRWGELAGLDASHLDLPRAELHVRQVLTRTGLRPYAKSARSHRTVPVPKHLLPPLRDLAGAGLVFAQPGGKPLDESNFRQRIWAPALREAGVAYAPPHTMRHTAASWLVMAGVDLYRVQALLGHESYRTTERYAHLAPSAHDALRDAWATMGDTGKREAIPADTTRR